jgi:hypothetical protein
MILLPEDGNHDEALFETEDCMLPNGNVVDVSACNFNRNPTYKYPTSD